MTPQSKKTIGMDVRLLFSYQSLAKAS